MLSALQAPLRPQTELSQDQQALTGPCTREAKYSREETSSRPSKQQFRVPRGHTTG